MVKTIIRTITLFSCVLFILILSNQSFASGLDKDIPTPESMVLELDKSQKLLAHQPLISHAGGSIYGFRYTNSLDAIEKSYSNGFRFIEVDFEWTSDNEVVLIHDWASTVNRLFMTENKVFSLEEFTTTTVFQDLTLLTLEDLIIWLENHPDTHIITDVKTKNLELLKLISEMHNHIQHQIVPQIYSFDEYDTTKNLGYENIILTLYRTNASNDEVLHFAEKHSLFAVTMPVERGFSELPSRLKEINVKTYVHTINDLSKFEQLYANGVYGIYTDYFEMSNWVNH